MSNEIPNPIVAEIALRSYAGWTVRKYADGTYDATHTGGALSWGCDTFAHAVAAAKYLDNGERGDLAEVPGFLNPSA